MLGDGRECRCYVTGWCWVAGADGGWGYRVRVLVWCWGRVGVLVLGGGWGCWMTGRCWVAGGRVLVAGEGTGWRVGVLGDGVVLVLGGG